jgi:peptidoglycan hydrolase-like protein with peptidoglycan-binding domain
MAKSKGVSTKSKSTAKPKNKPSKVMTILKWRYVIPGFIVIAAAFVGSYFLTQSNAATPTLATVPCSQAWKINWYWDEYDGYDGNSWEMKCVRDIQTIAYEDIGGTSYLTSNNIDGMYGPNTVAWVKSFQRNNGISGSQVDGVVGPQTWGKMCNVARTSPYSDPLYKAAANAGCFN